MCWSFCLDVGTIFWNAAAVLTITLKLFLLKCSSCSMCISYTSSSSRMTPQFPLVEILWKQLFGGTFLRNFVSTLPLSTQFSSVPLLSLRTHPTSFPSSNSSWDTGGKGIGAFWNWILAWSAAHPREESSLSLPLDRNFLFSVSCSLILELYRRQRDSLFKACWEVV